MKHSEFLSNRRGNVALLAAGIGGVLCITAALAIDLGSIALDARRLQGAADLSATAAAIHLDNAEAIAGRTAVANSRPGVLVATVLGQYKPDRAVAPEARFTPGAKDPDAVRVTLTSQSPLFFGGMILGRNWVEVKRSATASVRSQPKAAFSIGSRLASLSGGVPNQVLSGLTGSSVSLNAMDYNALAAADVDLLQYFDALAVKTGVKAGDYDSLLERQVTTGDALKVLETIAGSQASSALSQLSRAAGGKTIDLDRLLTLEPGQSDLLDEGLTAKVSALDLVMAVLEIGAGDRQIALDFGAQTGLAGLKGTLAIGERPNGSAWMTVSKSGQPVISTAQARLYLTAQTSQKLSGLAQVSLPIFAELAPSQARLDAIDCNAGTVTLGVRPGLAKASIGAIDTRLLGDFKRPITPEPATLLSVAGLVSIAGKADVEAADTTFRSTKFTASEIAAHKIKTVQTTQIAESLVSSLLQRLSVDVKALGLGVGLGGLTSALGVLLNPLGPVIDSLLNPLLDLLGLHFGEADVAVNGVECLRGGAKLVG